MMRVVQRQQEQKQLRRLRGLGGRYTGRLVLYSWALFGGNDKFDPPLTAAPVVALAAGLDAG